MTGKPAIFVLLLASLAGVAQTSPAKPAGPPEQLSPQATPRQGKKADHAAAYYHYAMAHMYEELVAMYGRPEYANKAIDEYRLAIENDPASEYLNSGLAARAYHEHVAAAGSPAPNAHEPPVHSVTRWASHSSATPSQCLRRAVTFLASVAPCLLSLPARLDMPLDRLALRLLELPLGGVRDGT